jgi:hypothetical protein
MVGIHLTRMWLVNPALKKSGYEAKLKMIQAKVTTTTDYGEGETLKTVGNRATILINIERSVCGYARFCTLIVASSGFSFMQTLHSIIVSGLFDSQCGQIHCISDSL